MEVGQVGKKGDAPEVPPVGERSLGEERTQDRAFRGGVARKRTEEEPSEIQGPHGRSQGVLVKAEQKLRENTARKHYVLGIAQPLVGF